MLQKSCVVAVCVMVFAGCGGLPDDGSGVERSQSALVDSKQYVMVPAYFNTQTVAVDFDTLSNWDSHNSRHGIKSVVVNLGCENNAPWTNGNCAAQPATMQLVAGGPGSIHDPDLATKQAALAGKIAQFHAAGLEVFGYVDFYPNRPSADIVSDLAGNGGTSGWGLMGANTGQFVDGYFFDDADRSNSNGVARAEYFATAAYWAHPFAWTRRRVIFNYGVTHPWTGDYVRCLANHYTFNWFVTQEHDLATFNQIDQWGEFGSGGNSYWMNGYIPDHFINIVHDVPTTVTLSTIQDIINRTRILNAGQLYIKEVASDGNTYGLLAQNSVLNPGTSPIFDDIVNASISDTAEYAHGGTSDPSPGSCPAEADTAE